MIINHITLIIFVEFFVRFQIQIKCSSPNTNACNIFIFFSYQNNIWFFFYPLCYDIIPFYLYFIFRKKKKNINTCIAFFII